MTRTLGGMEILGEISTGGMGEVLLARRIGAHGFEKLVAIKTIRPELSERGDIRDLFLDEARLVARIQHPAVTQVHDFGEETGTLFLAMEYVQGVSLDGLLDRTGALPPGIAAQVAQQACRGLHAAHELTDADGRSLGVVHRDVSPSNLMLTFDGGVKILDFGIALMRDRRAPHTQVGRVRGKVAYMAPEQIAGEASDRRTDVWGLANVLFELLTGSRLRKHVELSRIADELERPAPAPSSIAADVPRILDDIVLRGLSRDPKLRFRDAREMARALESAVQEIGGEKLEEFALRELTEQREAHQKMLATLLHGAAPEPKESRGPTLVASGTTPPPEIEPTVVQPAMTKPLWVIMAAGLVAGVSLGVIGLFYGDPPPPRMPAIEPIAEDVAEEQPEPSVEPPVPRTIRKISKRIKRPPAKAPPPPPPIAQGHGTITVGAHPYAVVLIDGKEYGATPLLDAKVSAGVHEIRLLDPATRALRSSRKVEIKEGEHERIMIQ